MLSQQGVKVNITHPVTIGQHEPLVPYVLLHPFYATAGLSIQAGIHQRQNC